MKLALQTFGDPGDPAILLIAGMGTAMDHWESGFCQGLARGGRYVVRYDHRDTGASTHWPPGAPGYTADDLAHDPIRLLDRLGVRRAHLLGMSMGGGIAQQLAAGHRDRLHTLTLLATTAAGTRRPDDELPGPTERVLRSWRRPVRKPNWSDRAKVIDYLVAIQRPYVGNAVRDARRQRRIAEQLVDRVPHLGDLAGADNHAMLAADATTSFSLADLRVPTLVLHGDRDPLFPIEHGRMLAREIPGARLVVLPGLGHDTPPRRLWPLVCAEVLAHTAQAGTRSDTGG